MITFWIESPLPLAPLGFGVTAWSLDEALRIIRTFGYEDYLPEELSKIQVISGVTVSDLKHPHVLQKMGPIVVRGMWYPFVILGLPRWAEERITNHPT